MNSNEILLGRAKLFWPNSTNIDWIWTLANVRHGGLMQSQTRVCFHKLNGKTTNARMLAQVASFQSLQSGCRLGLRVLFNGKT